MYERFVDSARKVMQLANQEARRFNHEYIGTEHMLLGLVKVGPSVAQQVLKNLDVDLSRVRREVEKIVQAGPEPVQDGKLPHTPRTKKAIQYAMDEARSLNHNYVGPEHLLLGLARETEGVAAQILLNLGVELEDLRKETKELLGHPSPDSLPDTPRSSSDPFDTHPLIASLDQTIAQLTREKEVFIGVQDFRNAAVCRDRLDKLRTQRSVLIDNLRIQDELSPELRGAVALCQPIEWPPHHVLFPEVLAATHQSVIANEPVLFVGEVGAGRRTLASQLAAEYFRYLAVNRKRCTRFLIPNHAAIESQANGDYSGLMERLVEDIVNDRSFGIAVPELHQCCHSMLVTQPCRDAWKTLLVQCIDQQVPFVAWTTPAGVQMLRSCWPGLVSHMHVVHLPAAGSEQLTKIIDSKLKAIEASFPVTFAENLANAIVERNLSRGTDQVLPGVLLGFVDRFMEFLNREPLGMEKGLSVADNPQIRELDVRVRQALDRGNYREAAVLAQQLAVVQHSAASKFKVIRRAPRNVDIAKLDSFVRSEINVGQ